MGSRRAIRCIKIHLQNNFDHMRFEAETQVNYGKNTYVIKNPFAK